MGEWLLPVGVSKRKSKISLLRLVGGGGAARAVLFYQIPKPFNQFTFSERKEKTFAPSDIISFCKAEDGHHQKDLIFQQLQGPGSHGAGDGEWVSSLSPPHYRNTAHGRRKKKGKPAEGAGREKECCNNGVVPFFSRREFTMSLPDAKT